MERSKLCTAESHEKGAELTVLDPITRKPTDFKIMLKGVDSKTWREKQKELERAVISALAAGEKVDTEDQELESIASATLGWSGLVDDGKEVKFSKKECKLLYAQAPAIRNQVDRFIGNRANFTKG